MGQVQKCPYCSINQPQQLDHFMDKSTYGQLAVCRLNLVPLCSSCNHSKRDQPYKNFIHPYYQQFPKSQFFIAECQIIHGKICVNFRLDYNAFGNDTQLHDKLQIHLNSLNIMERFEKEANQFITELLSTCQISSNGDLQIYLNEIWEHYKSIYRLNDWRTAVIKGLIECPGMDISVVKSYQKTNYMINSIGA